MQSQNGPVIGDKQGYLSPEHEILTLICYVTYLSILRCIRNDENKNVAVSDLSSEYSQHAGIMTTGLPSPTYIMA